MKDPRSAVLLEDWLLVLRQLQVEPRLLLVHREPASNIRSFSHKGKVPPMWAEALWQRTYQQALLATRTLPKKAWKITRFETLLQQPQDTVMELCDWLQHPVTAQQRDQLSARVDHALPAFPPAPGSKPNGEKDQMHPATKALKKHLRGRGRGPHPKVLLVDELQESLEDAAPPLELNRIRSNGQTLLPKVTVTIVINTVRGREAEGDRDTNALALATALASAGHQITLLLTGDPAPVELPEQPGLKVHHLPGGGCNRAELVCRMSSWLQDHPCDVVHLQDWPELASGLREALQPHPPQLIVGCSKSQKEPIDDLAGLLKPDWLIAPTQEMASWAKQHLLDRQRTIQLVVNRSYPSTQPLGPAETWPIQLSWLAFHERLPRRMAEVGSEAKAAATAETEASTASPWRKLLRRAHGKANRGYQRLLTQLRRW